MNKVLLTCFLLVCVAPPLSGQEARQFPPPKTLGPIETYGRNIQRTMRLLATSTPEKRNTVRILFYGQSITEQAWWKIVADDLRRRFPHANLQIENRAIGGHSSPRLVKTAEADLYPFYPDLVIFHVYGDAGDYERIIRRTRERTTAEVLIQTDHLRRGDDPSAEETDPAKIKQSKETWTQWMNYVFLPSVAKKYGAELVNQRELWKAYLRDYQLTAGQLLKDDVHLNDHGNYLMAEIVKSYLRYDPSFADAKPDDQVKIYRVGKEVRWREGKLVLEFEGNRVDVVCKSGAAPPAPVLIDGKRPSTFPELYAFTRATPYPGSKWPTLLRVRSEQPLQIEDWVLTLTELSPDHKEIKFTLAGSKTGPDGEGTSGERFVSRSGRAAIDPADWNLDYGLRVFKRPVAPGFRIGWEVVPHFADRFVSPGVREPSVETVVTLAQGLRNGRHRLEITGSSKTPIAAVRVYSPPLRGEER